MTDENVTTGENISTKSTPKTGCDPKATKRTLGPLHFRRKTYIDGSTCIEGRRGTSFHVLFLRRESYFFVIAAAKVSENGGDLV